MAADTIVGPGGRAVLIPGDPRNTRDHAAWICDQVFAGEYDHPELPIGIRSVVDVGSHVGAFPVWAMSRWPAIARFDCFDPNEAACWLARHNADFAGVQTRVHALAVTEQPRAFFGLPWDWGSAKTHQLGEDHGKPVAVLHPRDLPAADLLKCDSEGTEIEVLNHYPHWTDLQAILVEFHSPDHRVAQRKIAEARGFRCLREVNADYGVAIWARP